MAKSASLLVHQTPLHGEYSRLNQCPVTLDHYNPLNTAIKMKCERILFPSNHPAFADPDKLHHLIGSLESYHELTYDMLAIQNSIIAINRVAPQDHKTASEKYSQYKIDENLVAILKELSDSYAKAEKNPVQKMRDALEEIKRDFGTAEILQFLCPQFYLSVETIMSGAVVTYIKAFNSSTGRSKLDANDVFAETSDLKAFHMDLEKLRNKHFAHTELQANKHYLQFVRSTEDNIVKLDRNPSHETTQFYRDINLIEFNKCVCQTITFLRRKINDLSSTIESLLTKEQNKILSSISSDESYNYSKKSNHSPKQSRK